MKKYVVTAECKMIYEASLEVEAETIMEAFDKAKQMISGQVAATHVATRPLTVTSIKEIRDEELVPATPVKTGP